MGPLYERYSVGGLHARNHKMVDSANIVVGFWNGNSFWRHLRLSVLCARQGQTDAQCPIGHAAASTKKTFWRRKRRQGIFIYGLVINDAHAP